MRSVLLCVTMVTLLISFSMSALLVDVAGSIALRVAADPVAGRCAVLLDTSGSTSDSAENRTWLLAELEVLLRAYRSAASPMGVVVIVYDEEARVVAALEGTGLSDRDIHDVVAAVGSAMRPRRWTNPLPAFQEAARTPQVRCVFNVSDGSLHLPPAVVESNGVTYVAQLFAQADEFARRNVPVVTIALTDAAGELWRQIGDRTGGAYLLSPEENSLAAALESLLGTATPSPTPTPTPSPAPQPDHFPLVQPESTSAGSRSAGNAEGSGTGTTLIWVAGAPLLLLALATSYGLWRWLRRPRLSGWLEMEEERDG